MEIKRQFKWVGLAAAVAVVVGAVIWLVVRPDSGSQPADEQALPALAVASENAVPVPENDAAQSDLKPVEAPLSDTVQGIIDPHVSYEAGTRLIKALGRNLSPEDVAALRDFLNLSVEDSTMRPIALNSLKNDVLEVLIDQERFPEGLAQEVVGMSSDPDVDYMWREYCLQFMAPLYSRVLGDRDQGAGVRGQESGDRSQGAGVRGQESDELGMVRDTLFSALNECDEDLAGTALLGLTRLARKHSEFDPEEIAARAVEIAEDKTASSRCRLTAMRVAAKYGDTNILVAARNLAMNSGSDFLRGAAVATLEELGTQSDKALLLQCPLSSNRKVAAAKTALRKKTHKQMNVSGSRRSCQCSRAAQTH